MWERYRKRAESRFWLVVHDFHDDDDDPFAAAWRCCCLGDVNDDTSPGHTSPQGPRPLTKVAGIYTTAAWERESFSYGKCYIGGRAGLCVSTLPVCVNAMMKNNMADLRLEMKKKKRTRDTPFSCSLMFSYALLFIFCFKKNRIK